MSLLSTLPPHDTRTMYFWRHDLPSPSSHPPATSAPPLPTHAINAPSQSTPPHLTHYVGFSMCF
ncbi:hypothetical protein E2C01_084983 [Portunus trituberculatus]|uniref:Uncharacterized protein n=1 Tax=Portunus trituberculatus TaxID=210409 RepID=A0A5B7J7P1_PORTR|nr:hypothetical protein [Portunus trituberculatus]